MKAIKHAMPGGMIRLEVKATAQEVEEQFEESRAQFAFDMRLRPERGKTLDQIARERLGISNLDEHVGVQVVNRLVPFALDKHDICPVEQPMCTYDAPPRRKQPFAFETYVTPKPQFELSSYEPVAVEVDPFVFDESQVDKRLAHIVDRFVEFVPIQAHPVQEGDNCFVRMSVDLDGKHSQSLSTEGRVYSLGKGFMPKEFDDALLGMEVGEVRNVSFDAPKAGQENSGQTNRYDCEVELLELRQRHVPELADEWVAEHVDGYDTLADLRAATAVELEKLQRQSYERSIKEKVVEEFSYRFDGDLPDAAFEATYNAILADLKRTVRLQGKDFLEYVRDSGGEEQVDLAVSIRAQQALTQDYALDALFRHLGLKVQKSDIDEAALELNPTDPQAAIDAMQRTGRGFALREVAARHRAARWLVEHSTVNVRGAEGA